MADPVLIAGLGNPGTAYEQTRHNVGFMVADELSRRFGVRFRPGRGDYERATGSLGGRTVHLIKPATFMNESGAAVADALAYAGLTTGALLVVLDDFQIPLGALRMRPKGSDGGHNGLGSVLAILATDEIPRLRCGIGREDLPAGGGRRHFVLSSFEPEEFPAARAMVARAADAAETFAASGIDRAMTDYNTQ